MIIYDIEIKKAILGKNDTPIEGVEYCEGWADHLGMGLSCIACYDYVEDRYRTFMEDNVQDFVLLVESRSTVVGFNNIGFDNKVLAHALSKEDDIQERNWAWQIPTDPVGVEKYLNEKSYDILAEIRAAGGGWCRLNDMVKANGLASGKTDSGAMAPVYFQRGQVGRLTDYCLADVWLTKLLLDKIIRGEELISSKTAQKIILKKP